MEDKKKEIMDLLKEWSQIRKDNANLAIKIYAIKGRRGINGIHTQVSQMKDSFIEFAKIYGKSAEIMAKDYIANKENKKNVITQYEENLEALEDEYEEAIEYAIEYKRQLEEKEEESYYKEMDLREARREIPKSFQYIEYKKQEDRYLSDLEQMMFQEDIDLVVYEAKRKEYEALKEQNPLEKCTKEIKEEEARRKKIQDAIEICDDKIEKCEQERVKWMKEIKKDKNNQLSAIRSKKLFFKYIKSAKKVVNNLIDKVKEMNYHINDEILPAYREKLSNGIDKMINQFSIENIQEMNYHINDEMLPVYREKLSNGIDKIGELGKKGKEQLRQKTEEMLNNSIKKGKEVNERYSSKYVEVSEDSELEIE